MKKIILALMGIASIVGVADAQKKTSGAIQYSSTIDPAMMASASGITLSDEMKARMPSSSKSNYELLFTATNASYMPVEDVEDSNGGGGGGFGNRMMRFGGAGGNREYYYTFADQSVSEVFDLNDTTYYMPNKLKMSTTGTSPMGGFRIGGNRNDSSAAAKPVTPPKIDIVKTDSTKNIIGFNCHQVIVKSTKHINLLGTDREVTEETKIWYTTDLGFNFSPNTNLWPEGVVLAIESRGNNTIATSIEYRNVSGKDVTAPKKAKLITEEEYKTKMESMMKRFRNNRPPSGGFRPMGMGN